MSLGRCDVAVVGGGLVGLASAFALGRERRVTVLEAETTIASHQSGRNSGVVHSGLYYRPGSLKATTATAGREALFRFCAEEGIAIERCGKLVLATRERELAALDELERRGRENGLAGLERLGPEGIRAREPHARGLAGLLVPETGIADFPAVATALARRIVAAGGEVRTGARVTAIRRDGAETVAHTTAGELRCRLLVNCAGLQCDRVARMAGVDAEIRIVPFRGEYHLLRPERRHLVRHLVYPVPDPALPFLGVHFTRRVDGAIEAGPNAVLAWRREGYRKGSFRLQDAASTLTWPGAWRLFARFAWTGLHELVRSLNRDLLARDLRRLVPEVRARDLVRAGAGVRAQAVDRSGRLLDDFHLVVAPGSIHVLNAPSPAATASLAIGEAIARRAADAR